MKTVFTFFTLSAKVMRQILLDYYRKQSVKKRGGVGRDETLNERLNTIVECKFFAAMKEEKIALFLGVTDRTVRNDWRKARMWLSRELAVND